MESSIILTNEQIQNKTRRIAYQIYEVNFNEKEIIIAGITGNGFLFAKKIAEVYICMYLRSLSSSLGGVTDAPIDVPSLASPW